MSPRLLLSLFLLHFLVYLSQALRCQCSSSAGGVTCYNGWCEVNNFMGKFGGCAVVLNGDKRHFACVRVKEMTNSTCNVVNDLDGKKAVSGANQMKFEACPHFDHNVFITFQNAKCPSIMICRLS